MTLRYSHCNVLTKAMHKKKVMNLKRLNIVFEDKDFEILQQAKGGHLDRGPSQVGQDSVEGS